jgi:hypothetical protein
MSYWNENVWASEAEGAHDRFVLTADKGTQTEVDQQKFEHMTEDRQALDNRLGNIENTLRHIQIGIGELRDGYHGSEVAAVGRTLTRASRGALAVMRDLAHAAYTRAIMLLS